LFTKSKLNNTRRRH